jgi:hypothetical protein
VLVTQYNESVLFASCSSPTGNFEVKNVQDQIPNVLKAGTGDQTIFVDDDGQAYLICSNKGGRGHQYVAKLRESDYLAAEAAVEVAKGSGREGNCMSENRLRLPYLRMRPYLSAWIPVWRPRSPHGSPAG